MEQARVLRLDKARISAAIIAAGMALAGVYATYAVATRLGMPLTVLWLFGPEGNTPATLLAAWSAGPIAAAISAWVMAPRTLARDRLAGAWMGALTYGLALVVGASVYGVAFGGPLFVLEAVMLVVPAAFILAPLLYVCVGAGAAWAFVIRTLVPRQDGTTPPSMPIGGDRGWLWLIGLAGLLTLGWLAFFGTLMSFGGGGVD
jgi:hypothetical protein